MAIELTSVPTLNLTYKDPDIRAADVGIMSATWAGDARVKVTGEKDKKFRIGFVQLLEKNVMQAIYAKNTRSEVLIAPATMPILDADDTNRYRPFYDNHTSAAKYKPQYVHQTVDGHTSNRRVQMWDEPESEYEWYFNNEADNPLEEFVMNLVFSTYVVARDITAGKGRYDPYNLQILKQWAVVLDRRYGFNTVAGPVVGGVRHCDPLRTNFTLKSHSVAPSVTPTKRGFPLNADAIFQGDVANNVFADHDTARNKFSAGENVKALAAKFGGVR